MYSTDGTNTFSKKMRLKITILTLMSIILVGCKGITQVDQSKSVRRDSQQFAGTNQALIYRDSPVLLTGATSFKSIKLDDVLTAELITTNNYLETNCTFKQAVSSTFSFADTTSTPCYLVLNDTSTTTQAIQSVNQSWNFPTYSDEFYQVNLFYHINQIQSRYFDTLNFIHKQVHFNSNMSIPPATKYNFVDTGSYWLTENGANKSLKAHSKCYLDSLNSFFSPSDDTLCFGYNNTFPNFRMTQDPTIIYHEFAHVLVKIMMNQRNVTSGTDPNTYAQHFSSTSFKSDLGSRFYDEGGALNEGIADYFSYYMNQRTKIGQWGLGAAYAESFGTSRTGHYRPMSENDSVHTADISEQSGKRLAYPQFLQYDPNFPSENIEGIHNAGMIISHYLVALTKEFKNQCSFSSTNSDDIHKSATNYVMLLLNETMAEVGDLTSKGSDLFSEYAGIPLPSTTNQDVYFTNLNPQESFLWTQVVNPPNFRRFFRIFGKNILHYISTDLCPDFSLDESERLLDDYGLLLFKSYEDRGNGLDIGDPNSINSLNYYTQNLNPKSVFLNQNFAPFIFNTEVNEDNRRNTILVSKELIQLDTEAVAYVFDGQQSIQNILANLTFEGQNVTTTEGIAGVEYNNGNVKISPGEVVGVSLNLFNNSNSTMAGVQVLANDWDHMKLVPPANNPSNYPIDFVSRDSNSIGLGSGGPIDGFKANHAPCIMDGFPKASEGGLTDTTSTTPGSCSYISRTNFDLNLSTVVGTDVYPRYELDAPQPICVVEYNDTNETKWVSQEFFRSSHLSLEDKDCLNNPSMSGNKFNPNECLIRVLPGAAQSMFGKIDAQKTWAQTLQASTEQDVTFNDSNIFLIEVNKWIPPGTRFNCRTRVRFSNCVNCFNNNGTGDDYSDFQYAGHAPYKIINFKFTVND